MDIFREEKGERKVSKKKKGKKADKKAKKAKKDPKHRFGNLLGLPCLSCDQLNIEAQSPLLYSNRDPDMEINKTSTAKIIVNK